MRGNLGRWYQSLRVQYTSPVHIHDRRLSRLTWESVVPRDWKSLHILGRTCDSGQFRNPLRSGLEVNGRYHTLWGSFLTGRQDVFAPFILFNINSVIQNLIKQSVIRWFCKLVVQSERSYPFFFMDLLRLKSSLKESRDKNRSKETIEVHYLFPVSFNFCFPILRQLH